MRKKLLAFVIIVAVLATQFCVTAVFADKADVKYAVDQLKGLSDENKGLLLQNIWDFCVAKIGDGMVISEDEILSAIINSLNDAGSGDLISDNQVAGDNKIGKESVRIIIRELLDYKDIIMDYYNQYKDIVTKSYVKSFLGLPPEATEGQVYVALLPYSVPVITTDASTGKFDRNEDVSAAVARKLGADKGTFELLLGDMNSRIDELVDKIEAKIGVNGITRENVIYVLDIYTLYEYDPSAPAVSSSTPANNATGVGINSSITVKYSKNIYEDKLAAISLKSGSTEYAVQCSIEGGTLKITPKSPLAYNTTYTVTIPKGAVASEVMRQADAYTLTFTTESQGGGGPVTPPSDDGTGGTTPTEPEDPKTDEPETEETKTLTEIEKIIESIDEKALSEATGTSLEKLAEETEAKVAKVSQLVDQVKDPEKVFEYAKELLDNIGTLPAKLEAANNYEAYDSISKELSKLAETVISIAGTLKVDVEAAEGKVEGEAKLGEVKAGELIDEGTSESLDLILAMAKQLNELLEKAGMEAEIEPLLYLNAVSGSDNVASAELKIPANLIIAAKEKGIAGVVVTTDVAEFTVPADAIELKKDSVIVLNSEKKDNEALSDEVKKRVGDAPVYDFYFTVDNERVAKFNKLITVSIPYTLKEGEDAEKVTVFYINEKGELENIIGVYDDETKRVYFETEHFSMYTVKVNNVKFNDVASTFWAANYIEVMASKGVVKGIGGNLFAPDKNVTRAEFVAMIVREFKLFDDKAVNNFSDVNEKDWFYPEVTSAAKLGIIQGRPGGIFAPNDKITREEMAKILSNVLTGIMGKKMPANKAAYLDSFKDKDKIADYAIDAVALGSRYKFFAGRPDGTFAPKDNANRAEASKLIYMLFYME
ncbi:MAG TPA: S-layer homology domain-containing protein [Clostridiales bacterium]|nr:S-layer homology domain-containing protein [Clostridiales bacterium]